MINFDSNLKVDDIAEFSSLLKGEGLIHSKEGYWYIDGLDLESVSYDKSKPPTNVLTANISSYRDGDYTARVKLTPPSVRFLAGVLGPTLSGWLGYIVELYPLHMSAFNKKTFGVYVGGVVGIDQEPAPIQKGLDPSFNHAQVRSNFDRDVKDEYERYSIPIPSIQNQDYIRQCAADLEKMRNGQPPQKTERKQPVYEALSNADIRKITGCYQDMYGDLYIPIYENDYRILSGSSSAVHIDNLTTEYGTAIKDAIFSKWAEEKERLNRRWVGSVKPEELDTIKAEAFGETRNAKTLNEFRLLNDAATSIRLYDEMMKAIKELGITESFIQSTLGKATIDNVLDAYDIADAHATSNEIDDTVIMAELDDPEGIAF